MNLKTPALLMTTVTLLSLALLTNTVKADPSLSIIVPGTGTLNISSVLVEPFDQLQAWEYYTSPMGVELGVENGIYREYSANPGYIWGLNAQEHHNVVVEVEVSPLTIFQDTGAGVMCRADEQNDGDGYYFMVNGNGYYSIQVGRGSQIVPLVDWQPSPAVHSGIDRNTIRALCFENQLAMYVNGELVASVTDSTYSVGFAGLASAAGNNGVDMAFDNLTLYSATLAGA